MSTWGIACGTVKMNGKMISKVFAKDGEESKLYKDILSGVENLSKEEKDNLREIYKPYEDKEFVGDLSNNKHLALALYSRTFSPNFESLDLPKDAKGEYNIEDVNKYLLSDTQDKMHSLSTTDALDRIVKGFKETLIPKYYGKTFAGFTTRTGSDYQKVANAIKEWIKDKPDFSNINIVTESGDRLIKFQDKQTGKLYSLDGLKSSEASQPTLGVVTEFLKRQGFDIHTITKDLLDKDGNKITPENSIDLFNKLVNITEGDESTALPEEGIHLAVRMIKEKEPKLFQEMMNRVSNYSIYPSIVTRYAENKDYQINDKPNIPKIKEEAIGKILTEYVIKGLEGITEKPDLMKQTQTWWQRIINSLKSYFAGAGFNPFKKAAKEFTENKDIFKEGEEVSKEDKAKFNQLAEKEKGEETFDNIKKDIGLAKKDDGNSNSHYEINGVKVPNRVTDISHKVVTDFAKSRGWDNNRLDEAINNLKKQTGVGGHADIENILQRYIDPQTGLFRDKILDQGNYIPNLRIADVEEGDVDQFYHLLEKALFGYEEEDVKIPGIINEADFPKGTRFIWEAPVYNPNKTYNGGKGIAGTIDFIAIKPDGKVNLFDWKFIGRLEKNKRIMDYMKKAYDTQMLNYVDILEKNYGISPKDIEKVRIIPIATNYDSKGIFQGLDIEGKNYNTEKDYLLPYTTTSEKTGEERLDKMISSLTGLMNQISEKGLKEGTKDIRDQKIRNIEKAILHMRLDQNLVPFVNMVKQFNLDTNEKKATIKENLDKINFSDSKYQDPKELDDVLEPLVEMIENLEIFQNLGDFEDFFDKNTDEGRNNQVELLKQGGTSKILLEGDKNITGARNLLNMYMDKWAKFRDLQDILSPQVKLNLASQKFRTLSGNPSVTIQAMYDINMQRQNLFENKVQKVRERMVEINDSMKKAGPFSRIIQLLEKKDKEGKGVNQLIDQVKHEFYDEIKKHIEDKDVDWLKANTDEDKLKKRNEEERKKQLANLPNIPYTGTPEQIEKAREEKRDEIMRSTDYNNKYFWSQENVLRQFPKTDLWHTNEYKELLKKENQPYKEFYDFIQEWNEAAVRSGYLHWGQKKNFLPFIEKSLADKLAFGGRYNVWDHIRKSITVLKNQGERVEKRDPKTGELISQLPKYFTNDIARTNEDGKKDYSNISDDLVKNYAMFVSKYIDYESKRNVENIMEALTLVEQSKGRLETNSKGEHTGRLIYDNVNLQPLKDAIQTHVYGQEILSNYDARGGHLKIDGKEYEYSAVQAAGALKIMATNNYLGFGFITSVFRTITTGATGYYNAGEHYTVKEFNKAYRDFAGMRVIKDNYKLHTALMQTFLPVEENLMVGLHELTASKVSGADFQEYILKMVKSAHNIVQYSNFLAHLQNAIIIDGKVVNARDYYRRSPEYQNKYNLSSQDRSSLEKGMDSKIKELIDKYSLLKQSIFNDKTGKLEINGLDLNNFSVSDFKSLIRVKGRMLSGNISENDQSAIRNDAMARMMFLFTNWLPQAAIQRFGSLNYTEGIKAYEYGRMRMLGNMLLTDTTGYKGIIPRLKLLRDVYKATEKGVDAMNTMYNNHKEEYFKRTGLELKMTPTEFNDMVRSNMKRQVKELQVLLSFLGLHLGLMAVLPKKDDDDWKDAQGYFAFMQRVVNRGIDELQIFYNPVKFAEFGTGSKFPALSVTGDVLRATQHIAKYGYGLVTGEEEDEMEKQHVVPYIFKTIPAGNNFINAADIVYPEWMKENENSRIVEDPEPKH